MRAGPAVRAWQLAGPARRQEPDATSGQGPDRLHPSWRASARSRAPGTAADPTWPRGGPGTAPDVLRPRRRSRGGRPAPGSGSSDCRGRSRSRGAGRRRISGSGECRRADRGAGAARSPRPVASRPVQAGRRAPGRRRRGPRNWAMMPPAGAALGRRLGPRAARVPERPIELRIGIPLTRVRGPRRAVGESHRADRSQQRQSHARVTYGRYPSRRRACRPGAPKPPSVMEDP